MSVHVFLCVNTKNCFQLDRKKSIAIHLKSETYNGVKEKKMPRLTFLTTTTIMSAVTGEGGSRFLRIPVEAFFAFLAFLCRSILHGRSDVALLR